MIVKVTSAAILRACCSDKTRFFPAPNKGRLKYLTKRVSPLANKNDSSVSGIFSV